jgi:hypothetical protein
VSAAEAEATRLNYLSPVYKIDEAEHSKLISEAAEVRDREGCSLLIRYHSVFPVCTQKKTQPLQLIVDIRDVAIG